MAIFQPAPRIAADELRGDSCDQIDIGRLAQRKRRARILAVTRQMIGQRGYDGLVMKEIARECDVSIQTIYNLVGDRPQLASTAVNEYITCSLDQARHTSDYPNVFLALADIYWSTAVEHADYIREATLVYFSRHQQYRVAVSNVSKRAFTEAFISIRRQGMLRDDGDPHALADRFSCLASATVFEWASGLRTLKELRVDLAEGCGYMLRGALTEALGDRVGHWMQQVRNA